MAFQCIPNKSLFNFKWSLFMKLTFRHRENNGKRWRSSYFLTTPIFYVNAEPHIGHLYTAVLADVTARYQKIKNPEIEIKFMSGTDEHGLKIRKAAIANQTSEQLYCDNISEKYKTLFNVFNIGVTDFLRTTEQRHKDCVLSFWEQVFNNGHIYMGEYKGWYCVSDEAFVKESQLSPTCDSDGTRYILESKSPVESVTEANYKFKLSHFQDDLLHWLKTDGVVQPNYFQELLIQYIVDGTVLEDISVSRPAERIKWGIPVPGDSSQLIYVWFDALSCYLTTNGYPSSNFQWPPDLQIIGKDILKFHGVYWPAFLMAANLEPPKRILCHCHWLINGEKMSKSKGNVVNPIERAATYTSDGFRYFLLQEGVRNEDGDYSEEKIKHTLNVELANTLGNLLSRCCGKTLNPQQIFPRVNLKNLKQIPEHGQELMKSLELLPDIVQEHFDNYEYSRGIHSIIISLHLSNRFFTCEKPWELRKDPQKSNHLHSVLHLTMEALRVCGTLLQPIVPDISCKLLNKLGTPESSRSLEDARRLSWKRSDPVGDVPLLPENTILYRSIQAARS